MQRFFSELQRRKVLRVASAYVVAGWIILQVAVALQTAMSLSASFSSFILALLVIGFPIALALAWSFEITPEGIKRTVASGEGATIKPQTTDFILVGMLALVLVVAVVQAVMPRDSAPAATTTAGAGTPKPKSEPPALGDKSIAVLPFANLSPDKEEVYFADGMADEIINILSRIHGIRVISRTSSFAFRGKELSLSEIAKQLSVRHVLEGSVRRVGDDVTIAAKLIDVESDTTLWSDTFERKTEGVFTVQHDIARAIAGALNVELSASAGPREAPTKNMEAYHLFLKARELYLRRNSGDVVDSIDLYKLAIALDANFAEAHVGLAASYMAEASKIEGLRNFVRFEELAPLAQRSAETALAIDPKLARGHALLGFLAAFELKWEVANQSFSRAKSLDPSDSITLGWLSLMQLQIGEFEDAARTTAKIDRIDPLYNLARVRAMAVAFASGNDGNAMINAEKILQSSVAFSASANWVLACTAQAKGDHAQAEKYFRSLMGLSGRNKAVVGPVVRALSSEAAIGPAVKALKEQQVEDPTFEPERLFVLIGDDDAFLDSLKERLARGEIGRVSYYWIFAWRSIVQGKVASPKLKEFMRSLGLVDYWKKHGWPDRCRPQGADDFVCS